MLKLNLLLIFSSIFFFVPIINSVEENCYLFWEFVKNESDGTLTNALRGTPLNTSQILTIDDIDDASNYNSEISSGGYTYTFSRIGDVVEVNYTCPMDPSGGNEYNFRNNVSEINRTGLERFISFDVILSNYHKNGTKFKYWIAFQRQGFDSSIHYDFEDFDINRQRNGFTVMMNNYMTSLMLNDKVIYVFKNSDPTSTVVRLKIDSSVGSEYTALAMNYTDKTTHISGTECFIGGPSSINDTFFQTDFAKTKIAGHINKFESDDTFKPNRYGRIYVINKDSENSSFPIIVETRAGCPWLAPDDWELTIKPFDRSFPTGVATGTVYENTEPSQNAFYILPTGFEDNDEKFALAFALAKNDYNHWMPYLRYLPHENFCPLLDDDALVEFNAYRPSETFEQIAYPDGCLQGDNHNITVQTQLCNDPLTEISNVLFGNESQINEQDGLFVFWERKGNGEIFAVYSCDSIAFNHTNTSVPNEVHLNLTEDYIILQNGSTFDILFADENTGLFYKTVPYENFCPYLDPNLNLANATNQTLHELVNNSECTSQGDSGIHYSGNACPQPALEADFRLSYNGTLSYIGDLVNFTFSTKTEGLSSRTDIDVFYSCDGGVLYQSLVLKKNSIWKYVIIGAFAGFLVLGGIAAGIGG